jgi:hypothetical protein
MAKLRSTDESAPPPFLKTSQLPIQTYCGPTQKCSRTSCRNRDTYYQGSQNFLSPLSLTSGVSRHASFLFRRP